MTGPDKQSIWINKKTNRRYIVEDIVQNKDDIDGDSWLVLYRQVGMLERYTRSIANFYEKFVSVEDLYSTES